MATKSSTKKNGPVPQFAGNEHNVQEYREAEKKAQSRLAGQNEHNVKEHEEAQKKKKERLGI